MNLKIPPGVAIHFPNAENSQEKHTGFFVHPYCCFWKWDSGITLELNLEHLLKTHTGIPESGPGNTHLIIPPGLLTLTEAGNALEWKLWERRPFLTCSPSAPGPAPGRELLWADTSLNAYHCTTALMPESHSSPWLLPAEGVPSSLNSCSTRHATSSWNAWGANALLSALL